MAEAANPAKDEVKKGRLGEIARAFLRLGFVAFGGAAAHIGLMEEEFVRRRKWLSREDFLDRLGAVNLLPGPTSTELVIYLGQLRGGFSGLLTAGACFILPAAFMTLGLAWAYVRYGALPELAGILWGVKPVVVVLLVQAVWSLAKAALRSRELMFLAAVVLGLAAVHVATLALLIGTGVAWMVATRFAERRGGHLSAAGAGAASFSAGAHAGGAPSGNVAAFGGVSSFVAATTSGVFLYFLKIGALLLGSGYVLLAVLREDLVERLHWLNETQLLDAIAVSQATPGPFFTVATFVGYLLAGWHGAGVATLGMFVPAFTYVALTAKVLPKMRKSQNAGAFLDGVNAAAVALMAFVGFQFAREVVTTPLSLAIGAVAAVLVFRYRVNSAWVVLGGALSGLVLRLPIWK
ncbi:MAG TPA: chromate efflux transporter [Candidatus Eisenbacteria bacterium]|nr:chromate efflux transporter [Candidatus Eisenbacteria bacterium]